MENSELNNSIIEIKTRLVLHPNEGDTDENHQNDVFDGILRSSNKPGYKELSFVNNQSTINNSENVQNRCSLIKMCQDHPLFLFGSTVVLSIVNLLLILFCLCGTSISMPSLPDIGGSFDFCMPDFALPSLTSLNMQLPGWDMDFCGYEFDTCKALAISIPLIFLITPCIFNWEVYEKEDEGKTNNKLVDFVRENPMLVFWTGYAMTFLNTMIIAFCYCGVPEIPLPDCMTNMTLPSLPKLSAPSLPKMEFVQFGYTGIDLTINCCLAMTIFTSVTLLFIGPFMILCPKSPFYEMMKSQRVALNSIVSSKKRSDVRKEENSKIVQFVAENPQLSFWIGYSLTCLNIILLIACFCN